MGEYYTVMYQGENLYEYQMTNDDKSLVEALRRECMQVCDSLNIPREKCADGSPYMGRLKDNYDFNIKYKHEIGYFVLVGERGIFTLKKGFPEQSREKAKFYLLMAEFWNGGIQFELEHRNELENIWKNKYSVKYDSRKAAFEYEIKQHIQTDSCFTADVIIKNTNLMNMWFEQPYWFFNKNTMSFEEYTAV